MENGFKLRGLANEVPEVEDLSNTERALLRELAEPGGPLWKIMRRMHDYGEELKQSLVGADFDDPLQLRAMRKVQATITASHWVEQTFASALTDVVEEDKGDFQ